MRTHAYLLLVAACSSSSGTNAADECRSTVETLCARNADCSAATGETTPGQRSDYVMNCKAGVSTTLDCSRQTRVLGNPDACAMDLNAMPCSFYVSPTGLPVPASCRSLYAP